MSSRSWVRMFVLTVIMMTVIYGCFNMVTDPFGVFGDYFMDWWSYDMTNNPRAAKIAYLDRFHENYDSYLIGSSATSSFPVEDLNKYMNASFFNMIMYGSDMQDVEQTARYLIENYKVKNLMVSVHAHDAMQYNVNTGRITDLMHYKADGSSPIKFYATYLFADWCYGWNKIKLKQSDSYIQADHDCFTPETGAYDKSRRDIEPIGELSEYTARPDYQIFNNYPKKTYNIQCLELCMGSVTRIKELCDANNVKLLVVCPPMYSEYLKFFKKEDLVLFAESLSNVTDFWDFTNSPLSADPRYFYDETHFRNALGQMALAEIFGDKSVWRPEDFGLYVEQQGNTTGVENRGSVMKAQSYGALHERLTEFYKDRNLDDSSYTASVPILTYHETYAEQHEYGITTELFESHMKALKEAGFTAIGFDDLKNYVEQGWPLPEKPVVITFDDGYSCNFEEAGPVLEKYGFKATIFAIGVSAGKTKYKDTGVPMNPHFGIQEAQDMIHSGLFSVQSHTFDMHQVSGLDPEPIRKGVLQMEGETEAEYIQALRSDCAQEKRLLRSMGTGFNVAAYPYGESSLLSELIYAEEGIWCTVTTVQRHNTLLKGLPQCLRKLSRYSCERDLSAEELLKLLGEEPKGTN